MKVFLEVLGAGTGDSSAGLLLFFDEARYLFECGDGTQRFCTEYSVRLGRLRAIYLSSLAAPSVGGLLGMMLTMADAGKNKVDIIGPVGLGKYITAARGFFHRPAMLTNVLQVEHKDDETSKTIWQHENENMKVIATTIGESRNYVSYIVTLRDIPGKFNPERALELGVKKGRDFGRLAKGEVIQTKNGKKVSREDVMSKSTPGPVLIIAACPSEALVDEFVAKKQLSAVRVGAVSSASGDESELNARNTVIVHLVPKEVILNTKYRRWANSFGSGCTHILLHDSFNLDRPVFRSQSTSISLLNKTVDAEYFPIPQNTPFCSEEDIVGKTVRSKLPKDDVLQDQKLEGNWVYGDIGLRYTLAPVASSGIDRSAVPPTAAVTADRPKVTWNIDQKANQEMEPPDCVSSFSKDTAELRMLGTAGAIPGKYRNVSGIFLDMFNRGGLIFDCGEGSWGQLVRMYGREHCKKVLGELRFVFISHMHADHHLGLITLLHYREIIKNASSETDDIARRPLLIVGPRQLGEWLNSVIALAEPLSFEFVDAATLADPQGPKAHLFSETMGINVACIPVIHCPYSYGFVMSDCVVGWKVVYSGDTRPCEALAEAGAGATLAIHEATFEDEMKEDALDRLHSTYSEAVDLCANKMGAWRTILTHFSQRYARVPKLDERMVRKLRTGRATVAFDHMTINFSRLEELPALTGPICEVFSEEISLLCSSSES